MSERIESKRPRDFQVGFITCFLAAITVGAIAGSIVGFFSKSVWHEGQRVGYQQCLSDMEEQ